VGGCPRRGNPLDSDDYIEPLIGETLHTNQLVLNVGLTKLVVETCHGNVQPVFLTMMTLWMPWEGNCMTYTFALAVINIFSDPNASLWEGTPVINGKADGAREHLALDVSSLVKITLLEMRSELLAQAKDEAVQEVTASFDLMRNGMHTLRLECRQVFRGSGTFNVKMDDVAREQSSLNHQPAFDPSFPGDWQHVLEFSVRNTTPGS
jgi:hypothetical protein